MTEETIFMKTWCIHTDGSLLLNSDYTQHCMANQKTTKTEKHAQISAPKTMMKKLHVIFIALILRY